MRKFNPGKQQMQNGMMPQNNMMNPPPTIDLLNPPASHMPQAAAPAQFQPSQQSPPPQPQQQQHGFINPPQQQQQQQPVFNQPPQQQPVFNQPPPQQQPVNQSKPHFSLNARQVTYVNEPQMAEPRNQMNENAHTNFVIYNFKPNVILNIYLKNPTNDKLLFLACNSNNSEVCFTEEDDGYGRQKWIIEVDENDPSIFYIKTVFYHPINNIKYLGCPNQSGLVYLYTSKNRYTQWAITPIDKSNYQITYAGEKFDRTKVALVVARYAEDIVWTNAYHDIAIIYNKGPDNLHDAPLKLKLENVGREGHTYLNHIVENYTCLSDQIIFTQADPFVHNPTILYGIDNHDLLSDVQSLGLYYLKKINIPPVQYAEERKIITDYGLEYLKIDSNGDLICPDFFDQGMIELRTNADNDYKGVRFQSKPVTEGFLNRAIFPIKKPLDKIQFSFSALFSVTRNRVLMYPKIVYQSLLEELISKNPQGGVNGYILEKLWLYIFED